MVRKLPLKERKALNEEKLKKLLSPPTRRGRIRIVEKPPQLPRACAITGRYKSEFFIDLGVSTNDFNGQIYICADIVDEIAKISGYVPKDEYQAQLEANVELCSEAINLTHENEALRSALSELIALRSESDSGDSVQRIRDLVNQVAGESGSGETRETASPGRNESPRSDESGGEQRLANLPNLSVAKPPAI